MAKWSKVEKSWERQPKESAQAFEAFDLYCKMGAGRSLRKVEQKLNKSHTLIARWSSNWNWQKRSRDYDNELKRQEIEEQRKAFKDMQQRQLKTAVLLQKKAFEALKDLDADDFQPKDILRFILEGARLEKETRQSSEVIAEKEVNDGSRTGTLADTITAAYRKRMEEGGID